MGGVGVDVVLADGACVESPGARVGLVVSESELHATAASAATSIAARAANPYLGNL